MLLPTEKFCLSFDRHRCIWPLLIMEFIHREFMRWLDEIMEMRMVHFNDRDEILKSMREWDLKVAKDIRLLREFRAPKWLLLQEDQWLVPLSLWARERLVFGYDNLPKLILLIWNWIVWTTNNNYQSSTVHSEIWSMNLISIESEVFGP